MMTAKSLSEKVGDIYRVNYNKEILYNILLENHSTMYVNNLLVETLDPNHVIAKLYNTEMTDRMRNNIIVKLNKSFVKENKVNKSNKFKML